MKTKLQLINFTIALLSMTTIFISCDKDEDEGTTIVTPSTTGVYVVNEGNFGAGNSSISFLDLQSGTLTNNLFEATNGVPLGDVAQSMMIHQGKGYIVVNNSQKIEVVDISNFTSLTTINGLQSPRHMTAIGSKGYVCDWFSNEVAVIDLTSNTIIKHLPVGTGPEQSAVSGTQLFVANIGGLSSDSTVSVIDLFDDLVVGTITVGINPNSIVSDKYGKVWVLCGGSTGPDFIGGTADDIAGSLWCINPNTYVIEKQFLMNAANHPVKMKINKDKTELWYLLGEDGYSGNIVKMGISAPAPNNNPVISKTFYGLGIDAENGNIYGGYSPGFTQNGFMFRYNSAGVLIDSMGVGIAPNGFEFK
jgi:YVTN family beta-propeller protein